MRGDGTVWSRGRVWWISFWHRGVQYREKTDAKNKTEAGDVLRDHVAAVRGGRSIAGKDTVADAVDRYLADLQRRRGERSHLSAKTHADPLTASFLDSVRLSDLVGDDVDQYIDERLKTAKQRGGGTISKSKANRETTLLGTALRHAKARSAGPDSSDGPT